MSLLTMGISGRVAQRRLDAMSMESRRQVIQILTQRLREDETRLSAYLFRFQAGKSMTRLTLWSGGVQGAQAVSRMIWYLSLWLHLGAERGLSPEQVAARVKALGLMTLSASPVRIQSRSFDRLGEKEAQDMAQRLLKCITFSESIERKSRRAGDA